MDSYRSFDAAKIMLFHRAGNFLSDLRAGCLVEPGDGVDRLEYRELRDRHESGLREGIDGRRLAQQRVDGNRIPIEEGVGSGGSRRDEDRCQRERSQEPEGASRRDPEPRRAPHGGPP